MIFPFNHHFPLFRVALVPSKPLLLSERMTTISVLSLQVQSQCFFSFYLRKKTISLTSGLRSWCTRMQFPCWEGWHGRSFCCCGAAWPLWWLELWFYTWNHSQGNLLRKVLPSRAFSLFLRVIVLFLVPVFLFHVFFVTDPLYFQRKGLYIGQGTTMMSRAGMFRALEGVAVEMKNRVFNLPSLNGMFC